MNTLCNKQKEKKDTIFTKINNVIEKYGKIEVRVCYIVVQVLLSVLVIIYFFSTTHFLINTTIGIDLLLKQFNIELHRTLIPGTILIIAIVIIQTIILIHIHYFRNEEVDNSKLNSNIK